MFKRNSYFSNLLRNEVDKKLYDTKKQKEYESTEDLRKKYGSYENFKEIYLPRIQTIAMAEAKQGNCILPRIELPFVLGIYSKEGAVIRKNDPVFIWLDNIADELGFQNSGVTYSW